MKANQVAIIDEVGKKMGKGIVIRNHEREIMVVVSLHKKIKSKPILAECMTLWRAMELCMELNTRNVIFEGDAQVLVKALNSDDSESWTWYGQVIEDIRTLLRCRTD